MVGMVKTSWSWNHKLLITLIALMVVIGWQNFGYYVQDMIPEAQAITYKSKACNLQCIVESRAKEIYKEREQVNMEKARLEAIDETGIELFQLTQESPHVDYEYIREVVDSIE